MTTDTRPPYALSEAQAKLMQRAAWGLLHVQYEAWGVNVVRAYTREVNHLLTGIKGERRGAARKDSVEKLIRDGMLTRGSGHQVRPTPAGRAALDAFNGVPAPVSAVAEEAPETVAEDAPAESVEESPEAAIRRHGEESAAALGELRTFVEDAKREHSWATEATETAEEAHTREDAIRAAETADSCVVDSAKAFKNAKKFRTRVRAARKAIDALISGESSETAEEIRATASANEADAEELYGEAENAADACKDLAESAWESAERACMTCGFFQCACRETMSAVLNRFGAPVVDAQAVALGYMHLSDDPEIVAQGQRAIAEGYDVPLFSLDAVEDDEPEPVAELVHTTAVTALADGHRISCVCGWVQTSPGMSEEHAYMRANHHLGHARFGMERMEELAAWALQFPEELATGERVEPYQGKHHKEENDGYDWSFTTEAGHGYRLWSPTYKRTGEWCVGRGARAESSFWWAEIDEDNSLTAALAWCRADAASRVWAATAWARYGHMNEERVTWSAELVQTELEPNLYRVERYGRVGIMAKYAWGWEHRSNGWLAEAGTSGAVDGMFRKRAAHKLTVSGLREIPLDRWVITGTDGVQEKYGVHGKSAMECGPGSWDEPGLCIGACWNKNAPARFVVDILAEDGSVMGTVGVCALHLARPLATAFGHTDSPWVVAYERCGKIRGELGSALDWEERYCDLIAEMVTAALDAGGHNPRPDVVAALYAEADAIRAQQESKTAKTAKKSSSTGGENIVGRGSKAPKKSAAPKVGDIQFTGEKGRERADVLGHGYSVTMLAGLYFVKHIASGVEIVTAEPKRPEMKRLVLADAVARGAAQPVEEEPQEQAEPVESSSLPRPLRLALEREPVEERQPVTHADLLAVDGEELVALLDSLTPEQREALAGEWPVRWLYPEKPGDQPRGLNFCAGCGGGCKGKRLVSDTDMICIDLAGDAVATSEAAGCTVLRVDVKTLTPEHPALRGTREVTFTMPCTDWTGAGKGAGRTARSLEILTEAINQVGFAFGNYEKDSTEYCDHEENGEACSWEEGCFSSYGSRTDMTVPEMWALVDGMEGTTAGLMLAPVIWCLGLRYIGAPLTRVVIEQAAQLPEEIQEDIWLELSVAGCESASWDVLDAADFGSPSHRKRSIMAAHWYRMAALPEAPGITTLAHEAIGWEATAEVNTRGVRRTSGGNVFRMDGVTRRHPDPKPINGITSKIRGWYEATTERRFTIEEVCLLVGLPADYPVTGSRSSQCQQLGDIFSPLVSLAVWGQLLGISWRELLARYLGELYPTVHGAEDVAESEEIGEEVEQGPAGESGQDSALADTEEIPDPRASVDLLPGEEIVRYLGGWHGEYEVKTPAGTFTYALRDLGESKRGTANNGWRYSLRDYTDGGRMGTDDVSPFKAVPYPADIMPAIRKQAAKRCKAAGHRYVWLTIDPSQSDHVRTGLTCGCGGERLGARTVSRQQAAALAERNSYAISGDWEWLGEEQRAAVEWAPGVKSKPSVMEQLLEQHYPEGWTPLCTADMSWLETDTEDDDQPPAEGAWGLGQVPADMREIAHRIAGNTDTDRQEHAEQLAEWGLTLPASHLPEPQPVAVLPSTGRGYWETGDRVLHQSRAGKVVGAGIGITRVHLDGEEPWNVEKCEPRDLVAEAYVICGGAMMPIMPQKPEPVADDRRVEWATYERPAPVDPRLEWMTYEQPEPEQLDVLAELRAELEEIRRDVDTWGAEVAALAVAEAERVVAEVARDMRAAELLELREEARELRESLGWGPVVVPLEVPSRVRPWRSMFATAASLAGLMATGWSEGWEAGMRG
ncbi:hypothetical protein ACFVRB_11335 [Streptomyces nojiriensis]|uniref:hypothetical protein n=1 Tax=Streptomyces nojiriensis TaxID=66374 RepID=UPI0036DEC4CD